MPQSTLNELAGNFALFDDWEERYRYLIDLGRSLPAMDPALKTDDRIVPGCTSRVWMQADIRDGYFHFVADSDAHIVRGLIALLDAAFQGRAVTEINAINIADTFREIGLEQHLSPNRRNGFYAMVEKIKELAAAG
jgi:cysteine desulfuration protein SufE